MGSRAKAREFLRESDSHRHYSEIVDYTLTYFIAKAEQEGNQRFAADLRRAKDEYDEEFKQAVDVVEAVYAEVFTDEEIDDLIFLHSNAALKKARDLVAEIMKKVLEGQARVAAKG